MRSALPSTTRTRNWPGYQRIVGKAMTHQPPAYVSWGVYGAGFALSVLAGRLAGETGIVGPDGSVIVTALVCIGFLTGLWGLPVWSARFRRDHERADRQRIKRVVRGLAVCFVAGGISVRLPGVRSFYAATAFRGVTVDGELMLFWLSAEIEKVPILAIPVRLLSPGQRAAIAARWPAPVSSGSP